MRPSGNQSGSAAASSPLLTTEEDVRCAMLPPPRPGAAAGPWRPGELRRDVRLDHAHRAHRDVLAVRRAAPWPWRLDARLPRGFPTGGRGTSRCSSNARSLVMRGRRWRRGCGRASQRWIRGAEAQAAWLGGAPAACAGARCGAEGALHRVNGPPCSFSSPVPCRPAPRSAPPWRRTSRLGQRLPGGLCAHPRAHRGRRRRHARRARDAAAARRRPLRDGSRDPHLRPAWRKGADPDERRLRHAHGAPGARGGARGGCPRPARHARRDG